MLFITFHSTKFISTFTCGSYTLFWGHFTPARFMLTNQSHQSKSRSTSENPHPMANRKVYGKLLECSGYFSAVKRCEKDTSNWPGTTQSLSCQIRARAASRPCSLHLARRTNSGAGSRSNACRRSLHKRHSGSNCLGHALHTVNLSRCSSRTIAPSGRLHFAAHLCRHACLSHGGLDHEHCHRYRHRCRNSQCHHQRL